MPTKKKRASFSKSPHIAVSAQIATMEDDQMSEMVSEAVTPAIKTIKEPTRKLEEPKHTSEEQVSLEDMLASDAVEPELNKKNIFQYRFGMVVAGFIVISSLLLYVASMKQASPEKPPVVVVVETPMPTPTIAVNVKDITIEILNASGISGKAAKTADVLKAKGYTIVSTGNAKKVPTSLLLVSSSLSDQAKALLLGDVQEFGIASISGSTLTGTLSSARVILGLK